MPAAAADGYTCTRLYGERSVSVDLKSRVEPYHYKFDCVLPETTTQEEVFERKQQAGWSHGQQRRQGWNLKAYSGRGLLRPSFCPAKCSAGAEQHSSAGCV